MTEGTKWAPGTAYGPVLQPTELYLLNPKLELHPILTNNLKSFHLNFHLLTGRATGFNPDSQDRDLGFAAKNETATLPRVTELIIIAHESPWCTVVKNRDGVTLGDICGQVWKDYAEHALTEEEYSSLPPATQDRVKRTALAREMGPRYMNWGAGEFPATRCRRIDWLRDRVFFDGMEHDDGFAKARLGYSAPNIFRMALIP